MNLVKESTVVAGVVTAFLGTRAGWTTGTPMVMWEDLRHSWQISFGEYRE